MVKVTNRAPGPRGFNAIGPDGKYMQVVLQPGEVISVNVDGAEHAALAGHVRSGDLVFGDAPDSKAHADADAMTAKAKAKEAKDAADREEADTKARSQAADKIDAKAAKREG